MADPTSLFDALAGAAGHPVNRQGLNAYVANSQAMNGLRSAQTEEALLKAASAREEQDAQTQLEGALGGLFGPGNESKAHAAAIIMKSGFGNAKVALDALNEVQQNQNRGILGDPTKLGSPEQTAAQQAVQGKVAEPYAIHPEFGVLPGQPTPTVHQTPLGEAQTALAGAKGDLATMQAQHPELFHTANGQQLDAKTAQDVADFISLNPGAAAHVRQLVANGSARVISTYMDGVRGVTANPGGPSAPRPNGIEPAPGVSLEEQQKIRNDFASGIGAKQTTSLNTMVHHSLLFDQIADQMQNGNFTPTNAISQMWQRTFGSPVPGNLQTAAGFLGREAVRATVNAGAGTGEERELAVSPSSTPDQMHGVAQTLRALAAGQLRSLDLRARRGGVDIAQLLDPEAQQAFGRGPVVHHHTGPINPAIAAPSAGGGAPPVAAPAPGPGVNPNDPLGILGSH